jgi:flagellin
MSSIHTNFGATAALATLRDVSGDMAVTQERMSSGMRVDQASKNAAYWSIATTMRSDDKALSAVEDALNLGAATVDVAYEGVEAAVEVTDEIKSKLVSASEPGVDKEKVNKEITQLKEQLQTIASSASFNSVNWLNITDSSESSAKLAASFYRDTNNGVYMETIEMELWGGSSGNVSSLIDSRTTSTGGEAGIFTSTQFATDAGAASNYVLIVNDSNSATATEIELTADTTEDELDDMISVVDGMMMMLADSGSQFGAVQSRLEIQTDFVADLRDWMERGISTLVDADMNEEATRLKALTAQQQLTIQALSIANNEPQNILKLFN